MLIISLPLIWYYRGYEIYHGDYVTVREPGDFADIRKHIHVFKTRETAYMWIEDRDES